MRVRIRLFAGLAEQAGRRALELELREGATAQDAWDALQAVLAGSAPSRAFPRESVRVAVNLAYAPWDRELREGDEVAFIPPVAGGNGIRSAPDLAPAVHAHLTDAPLDVDAAVAAVGAPDVGAVAVFVGTVREWTYHPVPSASGMRRTLSILYEAYGEMAQEEMRRIGEEALLRWPGARVALAHRVGRLSPGDVSLVVAVATPHRAEALEAVRWVTEQVKGRVPIWKKERYEDGEEWVGWGG